MISRNGSTPRGTEIAIRLRTVQELFQPLPVAAMQSSPLRLQSGLDELVNELGARRLSEVTSAAIELPASELRPGVEEWVRWMIISYCELRLRQTTNELRAFRHDAYRALVIGMFLFVAGLTVSTIITNSSDPQLIKTFFGDGLAVVIAWIGAWYPLDTLINYTRPYRQTRKVLKALSGMNIVVRPAP
ncbi:MAG: hypothetical protein JO321_01120 [Solirubrobacterales bacterium]|nr:hypothetical protein [Solirubrobacterales bacterium]MBV9165649.1 hypothetical protein [Solirubrobacterales bacterium]MBV9533991.1 hypothetical protein [Solirubrobacterales bacterium]